MSSVYFTGFNGIRFVAAFLVILTHGESFLSRAGYMSFAKYTGFLGPQGVNIFFALSGFLITHLLFREYESVKSINIPKFYIRRALRIWPLYMLILFLGYFVFVPLGFPTFFENPEQVFIDRSFVPNLIMLSNYSLHTYGSIFLIGVLWSVGTEEQFYVFWPILMRFTRSLGSFTLFFISLVILKFVLVSFYGEGLEILIKCFKHDSILAGCFVAYLYESKKFRRILLMRKVFLLALGMIVALLLVKVKTVSYDDVIEPILALCYGVGLINLSISRNLSRPLEHPYLVFLGKISYGLYMFHSLSIAIVIEYASWILEVGSLNRLLFYGSVLLLTIALASLSYYLMERPILKLKGRFVIIKSGKI